MLSSDFNSNDFQNDFKVEIIKEYPFNRAKVKKITTPHGIFTTPAFMPVGTKATVSALDARQLQETGSQIILGGNTYHMLCQPGMDTIKALGGMHRMMNWQGPMLTDSGGFQVFSLSKNSQFCKINEEGAHFQHPHTGAKLQLNPEISIAAQKVIGADIIMAFDQCTADLDDTDFIEKALSRTHRWLLQSIAAHEKNPCSVYGYKQALFGIVQGAYRKDLRMKSAEFTIAQNLDGIAIGGESIGFAMDKTIEILDWVCPLIPKELPVYTMGVGLHPRDLIQVVAEGVDMFDCVAPTRNARHGSLYVGKIVKKENWIDFETIYPEGRINISKSMFAKDYGPVMQDCACYTCLNYSRGYLHYLLKSKALLYFTLASIHNIQVMHDTCNAMREIIILSH